MISGTHNNTNDNLSDALSSSDPGIVKFYVHTVSSLLHHPSCNSTHYQVACVGKRMSVFASQHTLIIIVLSFCKYGTFRALSVASQVFNSFSWFQEIRLQCFLYLKLMTFLE